MEVMSQDKEGGQLSRGWVRGSIEGVMAKLVVIAKDTKAVAKQDPRRVIHSLKMGVALITVSLLYYYKSLYTNFGVSAMWAVITVIVVFEFSVGATVGKGLNRGFATLLGGILGVGAHHLACVSGHIGQPILTTVFVFLVASVTTFFRFLPRMKAKYDYGMLVFILSFCMVSISGLKDDEILELAQKRISTIFIGASISIIISILICPVWAGQDLHNRIALNIQNLAIFLEEFGVQYFKENREFKDDAFPGGYKTVLNSSSIEETLYNFAKWEPGHGNFQFRHPWKQYLKIGTLTHQCAYRIDALYTHLTLTAASNVLVQQETGSKLQEPCREMSMECGKALRLVGTAVKEMSQPSASQKTHIENSKAAMKRLQLVSVRSKGLREDDGEVLLTSVIPAAAVASLLADVVECTEKIAESVEELAALARFKSNIVEPMEESESTEKLAVQDKRKKKKKKKEEEEGSCLAVKGSNEKESGLGDDQICNQV